MASGFWTRACLPILTLLAESGDAFVKKPMPEQLSIAQEIFKAADADGNHAIDRGELTSYLDRLLSKGRIRSLPTPEEIRVIEKLAGNDQRLQFDEFVHVVSLADQAIASYIGQAGTIAVALETPNFACLVNPPVYDDGVEVQCQPPPMLRLNAPNCSAGDECDDYVGYSVLTENLLTDRLHMGEASDADRQRVTKECLFAEPFPPAQARFTTPFRVCTRLVQGRTSLLQKETFYWPQDSSRANADCDMFPLLLELALGGPGMRGVAADVGASKGNCGFFMMSAGHTVHFFDAKLGVPGSADQAIVFMTLDVNPGWRERAHLHGYALATGSGSLDEVLPPGNVPDLHLLKIDVDELRFQRDVLRGADALLNRTTIVQMELITEEIQMDGKYETLDKLSSAGFDPYIVLGTLPSGQITRSYLDNARASAGTELHRLGQTVIEYGAHHIERLRLVPLCRCGAQHFASGSDMGEYLQHGKQFAFVRRSAEAMGSIERTYGSCATECV